MKHPIIPEQIVGKPTNITNSVTLSSRDVAIDRFKSACKRLTDPPIWHELCGRASAKFILTDSEGNEVHRLAQMHDHLRIDIPGPGPLNGSGYDRVQIDNIEDNTDPDAETESFSICVRSSDNPQKKNKDAAHFFDSRATSTFIVSRDGNTVSASYHGRNEVPNVHTDSIIDNVRNSLVASGAAIGLSELQWSALTKSILQAEL